MIKVKRPATPAYFKSAVIRNAREMLERHFSRRNQERVKIDNGLLRPINELLFFVFKEKCAYCETPIEHSEERKIDRFRPADGAYGLDNDFDRNHYWWLAYDWKNLYPCCINCGKFKDNSFPIERGTDRAAIGAVGNLLNKESYLLVDPCRDNPATHLDFSSDGKAFGKTLKGEVTIQILNLNRSEFVMNRKEAASRFLKLIDFNLQDSWDNLDIRIDQAFALMGNRNFEGFLRILAKRIIQSSPPPVPYLELTDRTKDHRLSDYLIFSHDQTRFSPYTIKSIEICNFRTIGQLMLNVPRSIDADQERWLLLLGDNGIGKSSILQAIALTLSGKTLIKKLHIKPVDLLKQGEHEGYVKIHCFEQNEPIELRFNEQAIYRAIKSPVTFLIGYGATRLLPKGGLKAGKYSTPYVNIGNLFDYTAALTNANDWLADLSDDEFEERVAPALFDLLDLKGDDRVSLINGKLWIRQSGHESELYRSSDGYRGIVALACDLMKSLTFKNESYHVSKGIVLIDELGNHLHPRWRMKIVKALRTAFPRVQFIVSTHEPLCLRGLNHGEVNVMVRDRNNAVRLLGAELLPDHNLLRIDQLLTSDLFGLINTLDTETEKKFEDYYQLLAKPEKELNQADKRNLAHLNDELASKEMVGPTPQMQALYRIVNEKFATKLEENEFKTRLQIKDETVAEIKEMLDDNDLSWL